MTPFKQLTKAEEQIMQALWRIGRGFTKDIIEALPKPKPHYNTVSTLLKILADKGFVRIESIGNSNQYSPTVTKEVYSKKNMKNFLANYFEGSFGNMLSFFAKEKDISIQELEQIMKEIKKTK